ncbi:hypothetical protein ACHAW5_007952 [Stephanodiscus triporus]|uniref:Uncharacterized protein n=1 Tax=Stephanodiscus triporus TaxID=2934178 RepID=A0ABD3NFH9_9STRA
MRSGNGSSDDETGQNNLPAGVLRSRGGWADTNNIEIEHQRERLRAADTGKNVTKNHAVVDLSQFRNEEVGRGYKAKHVVRQREASLSAMGVLDMSGGNFSAKDVRCSSDTIKRGRDQVEMEVSTAVGKKSDDVCLDTYLKCKGMRDFVKEIDKILKSS